MSLLNTTGYSVVSLAEANIKTPKDLEGKKVAVTPGDPLGQLLQALCKANNVDCGKINMIQVDPAAKVVTVLEKKADALLGGADDQYFLIKYKGATPAAMRYADFGGNIVGMTIMTTGDTLRTITHGRAVNGGGWPSAGEFPAEYAPNYRLAQTLEPFHIPCGPWRAPGSNTAAFVVQSFMHEVSTAAGRDHAEFLIETFSNKQPAAAGARALPAASRTGRARGRRGHPARPVSRRLLPS